MFPVVVKKEKESESEEQCVGAMHHNMVLLSGIEGKAITLVVQRPNEEEVYYRMGMNMSFKFLMNDYCQRKGLGLGTIQFMGPEGDRLKEEHTPLELGMEDGDVVDAFSHQLGG